MKQVLQDARSGEISVAEVPAPQLLPGCVLVQVAASLVSAGTERAASEFAGKNLLQKAKARPDLVREVINKIRRDGLMSAAQAVRSRLDQPLALGYSSAGTVIALGDGVTDIRVGDQVACAGAGYAVHAGVACVPRLLVARVPEGRAVPFDEAAFSTVGAVALHGIRTADVGLGDVVAVIGLGLLGQLTVQLLKLAGCRVLGMDLIPERAELAAKLGADATTSISSNLRDLCLQHSAGAGVDAVLITAETASSGAVNLAGEIARDRGVVVAVGTVGMDIERKIYYGKELDFRISRSYGPGRYDAAYEQKGKDYPIGYVRWTETRNMEAFLWFLAEGKLDVQSLITHRFPVEQARAAYELIMGRTGEPYLGVLITYSDVQPRLRKLAIVEPAQPSAMNAPSLAIGLLGAGSFATSTLLPAMRKVAGITLVGVCTATGAHGRHTAEKFGFQYCTTDENEILSDESVGTIVIATRHHLHARQVLAALQHGKHVFCEKPLCLNEEELREIVRAYGKSASGKPALMVGFNRRFAPMALRAKAFFAEIAEPMAFHYRVNAGYIPLDHWVNDPEVGGGRVMGEVCHFVDFLIFLAGSLPIQVQGRTLANSGQYSDDNVLISLRFANGCEGTITYLANGDKTFSKERVEIFGGGATAVIEDFRKLELVRHGKKQVFRSRWRQDKGHNGEWGAFGRVIRTGQDAPIPFEQIVAVTLATMRIKDSLALGQAIPVDAAFFIDETLRSADSTE